MPKKPTHDLRIIMSAGKKYPDSDYLSFEARICYVNQDTERTSHEVGAILNPQRGWCEPLAHLADLTITAQCDIRDNGERKWYGFELSYREAFRVRLEDLEVMTKGLRAIGRKMEKLTEQFGYPQDLPTYCAHVAQAIGCTDSRPFGQHCPEMQMNGTRYKWGDVDTLRLWIDKV